jgi:hypothetical protein
MRSPRSLVASSRSLLSSTTPAFASTMSYTSALFTSARYSTTREERDPAFRVLTNATINKNVLEVSFTLFGALSPPRPVTSIYFARSEAAFLADSSTSLTLLRVHRLNTLCEERFPYALKSFARFSRPRARMRVFLSSGGRQPEDEAGGSGGKNCEARVREGVLFRPLSANFAFRGHGQSRTEYSILTFTSFVTDRRSH